MSTTRRTTAALATVLLLAAGATACSDDSEAKESAWNQHCGGALDSGATRAASRLVGSDSIVTIGGATDTAKEIVSEYRTKDFRRALLEPPLRLCDIFAHKKSFYDLKIEFNFEEKLPQHPAKSFARYHMGELTLTESRRASIYLKCSSSKFDPDGTQETLLIRGHIFNRYEPDGPPAEAAKNNLIVMHSSALAFAKALGCKNNAGLENRFVMPQKSVDGKGATS